MKRAYSQRWGQMQMHLHLNAFQILLKSICISICIWTSQIKSICICICIWKNFQILLKYFWNNFERFFKIYYLTRIGLNFGEYYFCYYSHCVLSYILKCTIIIFNKTFYALLILLCFIEMAYRSKYLKVFEEYLKYFWKVFAFAFEENKSICICICIWKIWKYLHLHLNTFESIWPQVW